MFKVDRVVHLLPRKGHSYGKGEYKIAKRLTYLLGLARETLPKVRFATYLASLSK